MASSSPPTKTRLGRGICAPLAQQKINLTFLTHVAGRRGQNSNTVFCTELQAGVSSQSLVQSHDGGSGIFRLFSETCIVSLYPHDQRPEITGHFLRSLAQARVILHGLASSPSAISAVISSSSRDRALRQLFRQFQFPTYQSPAEFYAAQPPPQELVRAVVAAYQEKVIKIYCLVQEVDLDLWEVSLPSPPALEAFGGALVALGQKGLKLPFLLALPALDNQELRFAFGLCAHPPADDQAAEIEQIFKNHLSGLIVRRQNPVAAIFVHGPHFGDRYGIVHTLVEALERDQVTILALSCTVSSISVIIKQPELAPAVQMLEATFEVPGCQPV
ncbi:MAG: ACT domain-containing protein, partial [Desulfobacca sp.]|nr:ACT domain-containing protein [Desulfobacca sp.]